MSKEISYQIRKTLLQINVSVLMNDGLGVVLEFTSFEEASKICEILNVNSDNNCKYEIITITKNKQNE